MASVIWISPPRPGAVLAIISKILGVKRYRPMMARSDGASSAGGFSTSPVMVANPSSLMPLIDTQPYDDICDFGKRLRATTEHPCCSYAASMRFSTPESSTMMSSPSMTTNGSSPT